MWYYNVALLSNIKSFNINQRIEWCLVFKALLFHIYFLPKFMWPISLDLFLFSRTSNIWYPLFIHFVLLNICSLVPWRHQMYLLYIEKKPQNTLVCFEPESNLKTKKNKTPPKKNQKQLTSTQSSPVPVYDVQLYSYIPFCSCTSTLTSAVSFY